MPENVFSNSPVRLRFSSRAFRVPGPDYTEETTQDAYGATLQAPWRYVVADGSGQTFVPRVWARALVSQYMATGNPVAGSSGANGSAARICAEDWVRWLAQPQVAWQHSVDQTRRDLNARKSPTAWVFNNNVSEQRPAAATLAGIEFEPQKDGTVRWEASIVGDTVLFLLRAGELTWYPLLASTDFDRFTPALRSYPELNFARLPEVDVFAGTAEPGDVFFIATDALAKWVVTSREAELKENGKSWRKLLDMKDIDAFTHFVRTQRENAEEQLDSDDTTLLVIEVAASGEGSGSGALSGDVATFLSSAGLATPSVPVISAKPVSLSALETVLLPSSPWPASTPQPSGDSSAPPAVSRPVPPAPPSRPQRFSDEVKALDDDDAPEEVRHSFARRDLREYGDDTGGLTYASVAHGLTIVALCAVIACLTAMLWWKSNELTELQKRLPQPGERALQTQAPPPQP